MSNRWIPAHLWRANRRREKKKLSRHGGEKKKWLTLSVTYVNVFTHRTYTRYSSFLSFTSTTAERVCTDHIFLWLFFPLLCRSTFCHFFWVSIFYFHLLYSFLHSLCFFHSISFHYHFAFKRLCDTISISMKVYNSLIQNTTFARVCVLLLLTCMY